jgi:deoxyuridine 5'-triphosphate nucleotidohydrolase
LESFNGQTNPLQEHHNLEKQAAELRKLKLEDPKFQESIFNLLQYHPKERKIESKHFQSKPSFPLKYAPNLNSKSKWTVRWHPKIAAKVKYAYRVIFGSINTSNPHFNPKLRALLGHLNRCWVCRLTNEEWNHPKGIITSGNTGGRCSAKVADSLVPQFAPNVVYSADTFGAISLDEDFIKFLKTDSDATVPTKGTSGSAAYDLFPLNSQIIPPHTRTRISTGIAVEMPPSTYGQIAPRSSLSFKHQVDTIPGVIDSDYRGTISVLLHNQSDQEYHLEPSKAMAQILFLPLSQLPTRQSDLLSETERGAKGFGSTDIVALKASTNLTQLKPITARPPGTTFLGVQPSRVSVRLNDLQGHQASMIVDSGSNISLISTKLLERMNPRPKEKSGQSIKINQVTGRSSTNHYAPIKAYFETPEGPVSMDIDAYIVKDMNAPLILGNDFADQYSLSILRENGSTSLKLGDSGRTIPLDNSVESSYLDVQAMTAASRTKTHRKANRTRRKANRKPPKEVFIAQDTKIPPWTLSKIPIQHSFPESALFMPSDHPIQRHANATFLDSIITPEVHHIHVINDMDTPIHFQEGDPIGTLEPLTVLDEDPPKDMVAGIETFTLMISSVLRKVKEDKPEPQEQEYEDSLPDLPSGPKTAEVPEIQDIPTKELLSSLDFNPRLSPARKKALERVVLKNHLAFSLDGRIGKYSDIKYAIKLVDDATPVSLPPYHASPEKREAIDKQLNKWFSQGAIQPSDSPWGAPVIVVYKNGKPRVCVDYRRVNNLSQSDEYPLPKQTDILRALAGSQWLSTFDALSGFQQVEIVPEHRHITAFRTHKEGLLEFTRLPFGLRNGPAVFQRIMNKVLARFLWLYVLVYIDDIVVYSSTFEDHLKHLDHILGAISRATITLSPPKCHIGYQSLILLGQRVSRLGVSTHQEKIDSVDAMKPPNKVKELQMFLGFVNYFASYIPFYTWITKPLYKLLSKEQLWEWTSIHQEAFELCKTALKSAPILAHPMDGRAYRLYTDASDFGIGAVLQQVQPIKIKDLKGTRAYDRLQEAYKKGDPPPQLVIIADKDEERPKAETWNKDFEETEVFVERVIAYWSRLLKSAEKNYSPTEKEALALKDGLVKFQPILEGERITAITDHSALTWSKTFQNVNRRLMTWGLTFSAYPGLKIVHRAGKVHSNVDPLSRCRRRIPFYDQPASNDPAVDLSQERDMDFYGRMRRKFETRASALFSSLSPTPEVETTVTIGDLPEPIAYSASTKVETHIHVDPSEISKILQGYKDDPFIMQTLQKLEKGESSTFSKTPEGLLCFHDHSGRRRLCMPKSETHPLMSEVHDSIMGTAHAGFERTYAKIANSFYWPRMTRDIRSFIATCPVCQKIKHARHAPYGLLQPIPIPQQPFEVVTMDFIGELPQSQGHDAIFVIICKLTKFAFFIPTSTTLKEQDAAKLFFDKLVTFVGLPKQIISDRDTRWRNIFWKEVCEATGSKRALTTAYHPQADGQTEILNQTLEVAIRAFTNQTRDNWAELLPHLSFAYNNTPHTATKYPPSYLLFGFHPRSPLDFISNPPAIERTNMDEFDSKKAQVFIEEIESVRLIAKDSLKQAQIRFENSYNHNHLPISFEPGDQVLVNIHSLELPESKGKGRKFAQRRDGPFEVIERVTPVAYRIRIPYSYRIHPVISIAHLEPFKSVDGPPRPDLEPLRENPEEYEVEEIVEQKRAKYRKGYHILYKCRWKGYGITEDWIPAKDLRNAQEVLQEWKDKQKNVPRK